MFDINSLLLQERAVDAELPSNKAE